MSDSDATESSRDDAADRSAAKRRPLLKSVSIAGVAELMGVAGLSGSVTASADWREEYFELAEKAIPILYERFTASDVVETMVVTEAENTDFFDVLGERMELASARVTSAVIDVKPCGGPPTPPIPRWWQIALADILEDIMEDMEDGGLIDCHPTWCERPDFLMVPTLSARIQGPEGGAIVNVDPTGRSYGIFRGEYWTAEGWGTVGDGRRFDGDPIPFPA